MLLEVFNIVVLVLAAWRLTSVVNREKVAEPLRRVLGVRESEHFTEISDTFVAKAIECFWCLSFWIGMGVLIIWYALPVLLYPFALSAAIIFAEGILTWLEPTREP